MKSKYKQLNDKDWLITKYNSGESLVSISKEVGCNSNSVRQVLLSFNIPIRGRSESQTFSNEKFVFDWNIIHGSLLGDGFYTKYNKQSLESKPKFNKKNKYFRHIEYVAKRFYPSNYLEYISDEVNRCNGKGLIYWKFTTNASDLFSEDYYRWYPKGIKVVPRDLIDFTPELLLNWFLDDGSSSFRKERLPSRQIVLTFSSQSFLEDDNEYLCNEINNKYDLGFVVGKCNTGSGYLIKVKQSYVDKFYDLIGKSPVQELSYKWK